MNNQSKRIDLYLGGHIGKWIYSNFDWDLGRVFCAWKSNQERNHFHGNELFAAISVHWPRIFSKAEIKRYEYFFNLHPGFLPYGRGMYPVFWGIYNLHPIGVTVHQITEKIDNGPILLREQIEYGEDESHKQIYPRVFELEKKIFCFLVSEASKLPENFLLMQISGSIQKLRTLQDFLFLRNHVDIEQLSIEQQKRLYLALLDQQNRDSATLIALKKKLSFS